MMVVVMTLLLGLAHIAPNFLNYLLLDCFLLLLGAQPHSPHVGRALVHVGHALSSRDRQEPGQRRPSSVLVQGVRVIALDGLNS